MLNFIDYYVDGDFRALCKDRNIPDTHGTFHGVDFIDIGYAAEQLQLQYIDACGTDENQRRIKLLGEKYKLESKLDRINTICISLSIQYNEELVKDLKECGIRVKFNSEDVEGSIRSVLIDAKRFQLEIERRNQLLEKDVVKGDKPNREFFYDIVLEYGNGAKVEKMDVMEFTRIYRKLHERVKQQEKHGRRKDK